MKNYILYLYLFLLLLLSAGSCEQREEKPDSLRLGELDPEISEMLQSVSTDTLEKNIRKLADFGTRHTLSDTTSSDFGIGAARRWIKAEMDRYSSQNGGRLQVEFHRFIQEPGRRITDPVEIVNVVATLPGTDAADDRVFVVSGHYDSRVSDVMDFESEAPGANDDASGTAAVMEMARVMAGYEFPATIVFMAVAGEEQGLLGARQWAAEAREKGMNIAGMFTNDIIGNPASENGDLSSPYRVRLFARGIPPSDDDADHELRRTLSTGGENDLPTRQLARTIKEVSESYLPEMDVWMIYRTDRYLRGGDHLAFLEMGYPAVRFSEPHEEFRHQHQDIREAEGVQYGDLPEFVDYPYVSRVTKVNIAAMANLARAPQPPRRVGMNISSLENDTRLRWEASPSRHVTGYEVVWRETNSPYWEHKAFVESGTSYTADLISKDNYLFGVRAVGEGGHICPAVYPFPFRD